MCGISGFWSATSVDSGRAQQWLEGMGASLTHRGPDAEGTFFDPRSGIALGHTRLSILDLSEQGNQPMWSASKHLCITYNGEVYNAPEIRAALEADGHRVDWRGHSDTEVVVEAIDHFGLDRALSHFRGMFAFALWDAQTSSLRLVRDRVGIKPLYYTRGSFGVAFASELRSLLMFPPLEAKLSRSALGGFLRYGVVPGNQAIVDGVRKVPPGTVIELAGPRADSKVQPFWSARDVAGQGMDHPFEGTEEDAIVELEALLEASVKMRMRADVPFGAFLSGGIDSSIVTALMQRGSTRPIQTFSIGNTTPGYDESEFAREVAEHLGCEHHEQIVEPAQALDLVPGIAERWDEPFADSSQLPTYMVCQMARQHVTVALTGDGGDELFGGYNRHVWAPRLWNMAARLPASFRRRLSSLERIHVEDWDRLFASLGLEGLARLPGDKLHKVAALAEADSPLAFYERLRSLWASPEHLLGATMHRPPARLDEAPGSFADKMMFYDLVEYLPDDILTKVDRASMQVSLEARVPLLDHKVIEFVWRLPLNWKVRGRTGKWILRRVLERHVPPRLFERPKLGFGVPIGQWLRGPLKDWGSSLLGHRQIAQQGIFDPTVVSQTWSEHQAGRGNHEHRLWALLMFQSWWSSNEDRIAS